MIKIDGLMLVGGILKVRSEDHTHACHDYFGLTTAYMKVIIKWLFMEFLSSNLINIFYY
jgi:hypothetical protein